MDKTHVLALDAGTGSVRAILFDRQGRVTHICQEEFPQIYPQPAWVEHDAQTIWETQLRVAKQALSESGVPAAAVAAIGITNQRETTVVWDRSTGVPVYHAIVWQDGRTADFCDALRAQGLGDHVRSTTGLLIDTYFSATKVRWILDNVPGVRERAERGELAFGTVDSWLIWNLTGGQAHVTDYSNASRTLLFDINSLAWDPVMLQTLGIPESLLPTVRPSSEVYGMTSPECGFEAPIPVASAIGDQQGALFGQTCFGAGMLKATYGTGGSVMMNTGQQPFLSDHGLLTTVAWGVGGEVSYALEGLLFAVGVPVQWLRDELGLISSAEETESIARSIPDTGGAYLVPAFVGLASPYWDMYARATITGMSLSTGRAQLVRAALESMAYQFRDLVEAMQQDTGITIRELRVDGGGAKNDFVLEFQADQLAVVVQRPTVVESTARGAAFLAGLATGFWGSLDELRDVVEIDRAFEPRMDEARRQSLYAGWKRAVAGSLNWAAPAEQ